MSKVLLPKIDTKEKMCVIAFQKDELNAKMAEELRILLYPYLDKEIKNLVLNFEKVNKTDTGFIRELIDVQQKFYDNKASLVCCNFSEEILKMLKQNDLLDEINHTPTESEAWDIVQMEEIERELLD